MLDPFCGCGTAIAVAERLGRRWIGVDASPHAIDLARARLEGATFDERGTTAVDGAREEAPPARRRGAARASEPRG